MLSLHKPSHNHQQDLFRILLQSNARLASTNKLMGGHTKAKHPTECSTMQPLYSKPQAVEPTYKEPSYVTVGAKEGAAENKQPWWRAREALLQIYNTQKH